MKAIVFDATPGIPNGRAWAVWSALQVPRGWHRIGARSWKEAINKCSEADGADGSLDEIQFWGHGTPGRAAMGSEIFNADHAAKLYEWIGPSLVWFRMCSVFYGPKGREFAKWSSEAMDCRVAGHTRVTGFPWQSGLYSFAPGESKSFDLDRNANDDWRKNLSSRAAPRTIKAWTMKIPEGW